jgi:hypothetical protein
MSRSRLRALRIFRLRNHAEAQCVGMKPKVPGRHELLVKWLSPTELTFCFNPRCATWIIFAATFSEYISLRSTPLTLEFQVNMRTHTLIFASRNSHCTSFGLSEFRC